MGGDAMPDPLCRLSIQHGPHTVDLALPRETPVGVLLPSIVDLVQRGGVAVDEGRQWHLSRVGRERLDAATSLHDNAIRDGELLLLTTTATPAPAWAHDDPWHAVVDTADTGGAPTRVIGDRGVPVRGRARSDGVGVVRRCHRRDKSRRSPAPPLRRPLQSERSPCDAPTLTRSSASR